MALSVVTERCPPMMTTLPVPLLARIPPKQGSARPFPTVVCAVCCTTYDFTMSAQTHPIFLFDFRGYGKLAVCTLSLCSDPVLFKAHIVHFPRSPSSSTRFLNGFSKLLLEWKKLSIAAFTTLKPTSKPSIMTTAAITFSQMKPTNEETIRLIQSVSSQTTSRASIFGRWGRGASVTPTTSLSDLPVPVHPGAPSIIIKALPIPCEQCEDL
jgi:hypothetical protein